MNPPRWNVITPSEFPWEREALDFIRAGLPDHEPYRAWVGFDFQTPEGAIYQVDLVVLTKEGFWMVEIKSRPGRVWGDASTWTWDTEGRYYTADNPLPLVNKKAKAFVSLLRRQVRCFKKVPCPYLDALVFLSAENLKCDLQGPLRARTFLRDRPPDHPEGPADGILQALLNRRGTGLEDAPRQQIDAPVARALSQAVEAAGIRPSWKSRRVGEYILGDLLDEGPGYQDHVAEHESLKGVYVRIRRYLMSQAASEEDRARFRRAAMREFRVLQTLEHSGILSVRDYKDHELGPALIFQHDAGAVGLDHFLARKAHHLDVGQKLDLLRQIADAIRYAHRKKIIHRALSPKSVLVFDPESDKPTLKVCYWQASVRGTSSTSFTGTQHVEALIDPPFLVYAAPELCLGDERVTEAADIFSLGAIAYHLFSGRPPAGNVTERARILRDQKGFDLSAVLDGAGRELQQLIKGATNPDVAVRFASVEEFHDQLERVEEELTTPDDLSHPLDACKGNRLLHGLVVERVLGKGSTSRALLVSRQEPQKTGDIGTRYYVLKVALTPEDGERLRHEAEVLRELRSEYIVGFVDVLVFEDTVALLLETAGDQTLAEFLRQEGSLSLDLLERFGDNLLSALGYLELKGLRHRDIKPENIGVVDYQKKRKQLVLFDFSLARAPLENIHAGTIDYLDPFLPLRPRPPGKAPLWDESAERYAAAVTLHELASGVRPRWGDGRSSPAETDAALVLAVEQFPAGVRESLAAFFAKALDRDVAKRHANADEMLREWRTAFKVEVRSPSRATQLELKRSAPEVRLQIPVVQLDLSTRAEHALERINIVTVRDLLSTPARDLRFMRGVGKKTLSEILDLTEKLRQDFPDVHIEPPRPSAEEDVSGFTLELLYRRALGKAPEAGDVARYDIRRLILGVHPSYPTQPDGWPSQTDVAEQAGVTRGRVGQVMVQERERWLKDPGLTVVRNDLVTRLQREGGVLTIGEILEGVMARDHLEETSGESLRRYASAVARAAVEAEQGLAEPRMRQHRHQGRLFLAMSAGHVSWAARLGEEADQIAKADPLLASARAVQRLRQISPPPAICGVEAVADDRLLRLATSASSMAALSPRQEIYPRGMDAERALRLGAGAIRTLGLGGTSGTDELATHGFTPADVRQRIMARYPEAAPLPGGALLTELLKAIGLEVSWNSEHGVYRRQRSALMTTSGSTMLPRHRTERPAEREVPTPEIAAARQFEAELRYRHEHGSFLVLAVRRQDMTRCEEELLRRFELTRFSLDEHLIGAMRDLAGEKRVDWARVLSADATSRDSRDWENLQMLAGRAVDRVREQLLTAEGALLLVHPGLLARYDRIDLLEVLRDEAGKEGRPRTCWVLVSADAQSDLPILDGKVIPLLSPGQRARVPREWIENRHRSAAEVS